MDVSNYRHLVQLKYFNCIGWYSTRAWFIRYIRGVDDKEMAIKKFIDYLYLVMGFVVTEADIQVIDPIDYTGYTVLIILPNES